MTVKRTVSSKITENKLVMLNSIFFQNRNSNPKNRLKLETCFLLYPSSVAKRVRINTFDFHSCLWGFACLCMKLIIFTSYNLQTCVNDIIKLYMWTCIRILFTTYKHGHAITIDMWYKIRLWVLYKLLYGQLPLPVTIFKYIIQHTAFTNRPTIR